LFPSAVSNDREVKEGSNNNHKVMHAADQTKPYSNLQDTYNAIIYNSGGHFLELENVCR
jgi:hypothetical protein